MTKTTVKKSDEKKMSRSIRGDGSHTFNDAITDFSVSVFVRHYVVATNSRNYRREFTASKTIQNRCRGGQLLLIGVARCTRHKAETANNNQRRGEGRGWMESCNSAPENFRQYRSRKRCRANG